MNDPTQINEWIGNVKKLLKLDGRVIRFTENLEHNRVWINFYNLLDVGSSKYSGADLENNRVMLKVLFPGHHGHYDGVVKEGKVRVNLSVSALPFKNYKLRGKTASPEKIAEYIAEYFNRIVAEIPSPII